MRGLMTFRKPLTLGASYVGSYIYLSQMDASLDEASRRHSGASTRRDHHWPRRVVGRGAPDEAILSSDNRACPRAFDPARSHGLWSGTRSLLRHSG